MSLASNEALVEGLAAAVPLRLLELDQLSPAERAARIRVWAKDAVEPVASHGDDLIFGSKKLGGPAKVFNHLAKGLAALSHSPGGVDFAGRHWCAAECLCPVGVRRGTAPDAPIGRVPAPVVRRTIDVHLPARDASIGGGR